MTDALLTGARVGRGGGGNIGRLVVVGGGGGRRVVVVVDVVVVGVVVSRGGRGDAPTEVTMVLQHVWRAPLIEGIIRMETRREESRGKPCPVVNCTA